MVGDRAQIDVQDLAVFRHLDQTLRLGLSVIQKNGRLWLFLFGVRRIGHDEKLLRWDELWRRWRAIMPWLRGGRSQRMGRRR